MNTNGTGLEHLVTPACDPEGIALDTAAGKMYWAETLPVPRIMRANLDGSGQETVVEIGSLGPGSLALDAVNEHLYWTDPWGGHRSNLDGSNATQVVETGISPVGLALDPVGEMIYWSENGQDNRLIRRANLDGTGVDTLVTDLGNPISLALDLLDAKLYWTDHARNKIQRANLDGTGIQEVLVDGGPDFLTLDVAVPEPTTALLLGWFGVMALRRRRRR